MREMASSGSTVVGERKFLQAELRTANQNEAIAGMIEMILRVRGVRSVGRLKPLQSLAEPAPLLR